VEGYDISGKNGLDYPLPVYTHGKLGYNLLDLISTSTDIKARGEWITLSDPPKNYDVMQFLDNAAGYDLVFVNYNTLRSIEDNANMLRRVIEWINADKAVINSTEKNVVVGVSMGGLVARYCLANMTKNVGYNSADTKLLITHDSPHQGSNVPLSLQYFLYDLGYTKILGNRIKDSKDDIKDFMNLNENGASTAQLLRARAVYNNGNVETAYNSFLIPGGTYQQMVDIPANLRPYRFVATAQGSQCGVPVSGSNIVYAHQNGSFGNLAFLSLGYLATNQSVPWLQGWGQKFKLITELKSLPFSGVQQIEYYKLIKKVSIFGIGLFNIGITERIRQNPGGFNGWDNLPGSTQSILSRGGPALTEGPQKATAFPVNLFVQGKAGLSLIIPNDLFSFVSTTSALDAPPGVDPYSTFSYGINGNANTRTDNYISQEFYTGAYNQNHTDYTPRNAKWMYEEMESIIHTDGCLSDCPSNIGYSISGNELICSSNTTYTVTGLNSSLSVGGWAISPSNLVTSTIQGNSIILTAVPNASGFITLSAAVQVAGCNAANPITKQIYVGKPQPITNIEEFNEINSGCAIVKKIRVVSNNILTSYNWISACEIPTPGPFINMSTGSIRSIFQINPCLDEIMGQFKTRVDATNGCGTTQGTLVKTIVFDNVIEYDQGCLNPPINNNNNYFITVTPNPVTSYATIGLKYLEPPNPQGPAPSLYMVKLMLFSGSNQLLVNTQLNNVQQYNLITSYLTPGYYRLLVQSASGQWLQKTIVK
jgi:hypothetical protein